MSRLDAFLPSPRVREVTHVDVDVPLHAAYRAVRHLDMARSPVVRALFALRSHGVEASLQLGDLGKHGSGFKILVDEPDRSFAVGAIGRFWQADVPFVDVDNDRFAAYDAPGYGKLVWELRFDPLSEQRTRITVELRLGATDEESWRRLRRYFLLIGPFSRFIRHHVIALIQRDLEPRHDARDVAEGLVGALGVAFDLATPFLRSVRSHWGLSAEEAERSYVGDEWVKAPRWGWTHAVEIDAPPSRVWPWVAQIGQEKGGFYSYQWLENLAGCDIANAERIHGSWQGMAIGDELRLHPDMPPLYIAAFEPGRSFLAAGEMDPTTGGKPTDERRWVRTSWLFLVEPLPGNRSRFISRFRIAYGDDVKTSLVFGPWVLESIGFVMDRRMLLGVKERVERSAPRAHPRHKKRATARA